MLCSLWNHSYGDTEHNISLSWGQGKGAILADCTEEVTLELGLEG